VSEVSQDLHFTPRLRWVIDSAHVGEHLAEISYCTPICPQPPPLFTRLPTRTHKHKHKHKHATVLPASSALLLTLCRAAFTEGLTWEVMYSLILDANDANAELTYSLSLSLSLFLTLIDVYIFFLYMCTCVLILSVCRYLNRHLYSTSVVASSVVFRAPLHFAPRTLPVIACVIAR
jgi:hypothetical protein